MSDLNDPRVFFAAERTLMAWVRTALALMAFGFAIERFALFVAMLGGAHAAGDVSHMPARGLSFWTGVALIAFGALSVVVATHQYRRVLSQLRPVEIPDGYHLWLAPAVAIGVALTGCALVLHLFQTG
ncbi:YidH family protein [Methyloversatilis thermotolerans]|jgi:putative membrane protein|uniref:YidH family protein n=1 Tax=Methyloversatilis thermotolerans TaxID=1346290 RepID=UPI000372DAC8|nr:DUF202 domain-containing protein [Methyloversatilis thermotolerans]